VDVAGIEPATPCLQTELKSPVVKSISLFGLRLTSRPTRTKFSAVPDVIQDLVWQDGTKIVSRVSDLLGYLIEISATGKRRLHGYAIETPFRTMAGNEIFKR
jgi:hypothetical protein